MTNSQIFDTLVSNVNTAQTGQGDKLVLIIPPNSTRSDYSLHNFISNSDFMESTLPQLGDIDTSKAVVSTATIINSLPFTGNALEYTITGTGTLINYNVSQLYVADIVFSFYIMCDASTNPFTLTVTLTSFLPTGSTLPSNIPTSNNITTPETTTQQFNVSTTWQRIILYHSHNVYKSLNVVATVPSSSSPQLIYVSGYQLENNTVPMPFFTGTVYHVWDNANPNPQIAHAYNLNYLSTIPPQTSPLPLETLMSYNAQNTTASSLDPNSFSQNQAIYLDGLKTYLVIPTLINTPIVMSNFSITCWLRLHRISQTNYQSIFEISSYLKMYESNGMLNIGATDGTDTFQFTSQTLLIPDNWYFVALTFSSGNMMLYNYNGVETQSINANILGVTLNSNLMVGIPSNYEGMIYKNYLLNADIGNITIWQRPLLASDIATMCLVNSSAIVMTASGTVATNVTANSYVLQTSGLTLNTLTLSITNVSTTGNCQYSAVIGWTYPTLPLDYIKLGYTITKFITRLDYYVSGSTLVYQENVDNAVLSQTLPSSVKNIILTDANANCVASAPCSLTIINMPYDINYRFGIAYQISNGETSPYAYQDLMFESNLMTQFNIASGAVCTNSITPTIALSDKQTGENLQNTYINYYQTKLASLSSS